jgi:hypothetical protein
MTKDDAVLRFLIQEEGFKPRTYIPKKDGKAIGNSGLTFGVGIDIGQMNTKEFLNMGLPTEFEESLLPYVGKKGSEALAVEKELGHFTLPTDVAMNISRQKINKSKDRMRSKYKNYDDLPYQQQAVGLSLLHNFGDSSLDFGTMKSVMEGDLKSGISRLRNEDEWKNPELFPRRRREARLLEELYNKLRSEEIDRRMMPTLGTANETQQEQSYRALRAADRGITKGTQATYGKIANALTPNVDNIPDWMFTAMRALVGAEQPKQDDEQD